MRFDGKDYGEGAEILFPDAWEAVKKMGPELKEASPDDVADLKKAVLVLAKRVAVLENEWS